MGLFHEQSFCLREGFISLTPCTTLICANVCFVFNCKGYAKCMIKSTFVSSSVNYEH